MEEDRATYRALVAIMTLISGTAAGVRSHDVPRAAGGLTWR